MPDPPSEWLSPRSMCQCDLPRPQVVDYGLLPICQRCGLVSWPKLEWYEVVSCGRGYR